MQLPARKPQVSCRSKPVESYRARARPTFSKVSAVIHLLCKTTIKRTFENALPGRKVDHVWYPPLFCIAHANCPLEHPEHASCGQRADLSRRSLDLGSWVRVEGPEHASCGQRADLQSRLGFRV
jgi:hypothetical protein